MHLIKFQFQILRLPQPERDDGHPAASVRDAPALVPQQRRAGYRVQCGAHLHRSGAGAGRALRARHRYRLRSYW